MSRTPLPTNKSNILGTITNLIGLLGVFLYFTGWIYRWAYFSFFQLEVTTLDLPLESFLIVPFQVFLGNFWIFCKTVVAVVSVVLLIRLTLWLLTSPNNQVVNSPNQLRSRLAGYAQKLHNTWVVQRLQAFAEIFPPSLRYEIIIVVWVLIALFWLARLQGTIDARRDALNDTSVRPVVTVVTVKDKLGLGRKPDSLSINLPLEDFRIIGDSGLLENLKGWEITDTSIQPPRVWRLLIERNGWIYLFQALPTNAAANQRPYVLVVGKSDGGEQLLILSPEATKRRSE